MSGRDKRFLRHDSELDKGERNSDHGRSAPQPVVGDPKGPVGEPSRSLWTKGLGEEMGSGKSKGRKTEGTGFPSQRGGPRTLLRTFLIGE